MLEHKGHSHEKEGQRERIRGGTRKYMDALRGPWAGLFPLLSLPPFFPFPFSLLSLALFLFGGGRVRRFTSQGQREGPTRMTSHIYALLRGAPLRPGFPRHPGNISVRTFARRLGRAGLSQTPCRLPLVPLPLALPQDRRARLPQTPSETLSASFLADERAW